MTSSKSINRQKNRRYGKKSKTNNPVESLESLDRFAGSSEDENDEESMKEQVDDHSDLEDEVANAIDTNTTLKNSSNQRSKRDERATIVSNTNDSDADVDDNSNMNDSDDDNHDDIDDDNNNDSDEIGNDNDNDNTQSQFHIATGMANAMSRILSAPTKGKAATSTGSIVLSKTKTPLQIQAEKEKKELVSLKETRRAKRERQIKALHIPLTVATNTFVLNNINGTNQSSLSMELERERIHRRVATRGIVALFNAIAHHQVRPEQTAVEAAAVTSPTATTTNTSKTNASSTNSTTKLTKHGFLDLIKQKAITATSKINDNNIGNNIAGKTSMSTQPDKQNVKKWNALKDDYMMDSTKNWDEIDDDDEDDDNDSSNKNSHISTPHKKRIRNN